MNCEDVRMMLDAYIDGELTQEEILALENHAKACKACGDELEAAKLLKDTLAHMDDDVAVPLQAQVAWRNAVRAEAKKKNSKRWIRGAYAAAAALVLVFGVNFMLGERDAQQPAMLAAGMPASNQPIIARDGGAQVAAYSMDASEYNVLKKISVASVAEAEKAAEMLAAEYSGTCSAEADDACRIEIPAEYLADFLKAAGAIGTEVYSEVMEQQAETAVVLLQFAEE